MGVLRRSLTVLPFLVLVTTLLMAVPAWAAPNLSITKEGPARVEPGERFVYTIEVRNTGPDAATGVVVTDELPEGVTFVGSDSATCTNLGDTDTDGRDEIECTFPAPLAAETGRRTIELRVEAPPDAGSIENRAFVNSNETEREPSNLVATTVAPNLVIRKLDDPDSVRAEGLLNYTLRVTNEGAENATNVVIVDDLPLADVDFIRVLAPAGFTCEHDGGLVRCEGTIASGQTRSVEITVEAEKAGTIENTAEVRSGRVFIARDTERTEVEARDNSGGGGGTTTGGGSTTGGTTTGGTTTGANTTGGTNTSDTTTAEAQADALRGENVSASEFRCEDIVEISQSANRDQYNFSSARIQECLARQVIDGVKADRLANTGGPPLLPIAACILAGLGIFAGRALFPRRGR